MARAVLAQRGRRGVLAAPTGIPVVVEADRRPGQLDVAEDGVVDVEHQALRTGLVPVVDAVDGADLAGRDAQLGEAGEQLGEGVCREGGVERGRHLVAVDRALAVGRHARGGGVDVEGLGELAHNDSLPQATWMSPSWQWNRP